MRNDATLVRQFVHRWLGRVAGVVLLCSTALAPARGQLAVNKLEVVFHAGAGAPRAEVIEVSNQGDRAMQGVVRLEDWDRTEDGTNRWMPYGTLPGSCGTALTVFPLAVSLEPHTKQVIRVSLDSTVKLDHECWAAAIVESSVPRTENGRGIQYLIRTATKIYLQPAGLAAAGEITSMDVVSSTKESAAKGDSLQVVFKNTGALHLEAHGELQIRRLDNTLVQSAALPALYTLPGATMRGRIALPALATGRYVLITVYDFGGNELVAAQAEYEVRE